MKKFSSKPSKPIIALIIVQGIGFIFFETLATWVLRSNPRWSETTILILDITKKLVLLGGLGLFVWLLRHKLTPPHTWKDIILYMILSGLSNIDVL